MKIQELNERLECLSESLKYGRLGDEPLCEGKIPRALMQTAMKKPFDMVQDKINFKMMQKLDDELEDNPKKRNMIVQLDTIAKVFPKLKKDAEKMSKLMRSFEKAKSTEDLEDLMKKSGLFRDFFESSEFEEDELSEDL